MNQLALLLSAYLALSGSSEFKRSDTTELWDEFKAEYGKVYESSYVESMRKIIFERNLARIDSIIKAQNNSEPSFSIGLNHLADLSDVEIASMKGYKSTREEDRIRLQESAQARAFIKKILDDKSIEVPEEVDWRKIPGRVTKVQNQRNCGSCWAFASTGVLEGQEVARSDLNIKQLVKLSEQNLVDCVYEKGCDGGIMWEAFDYIKKAGGIDSNKTYPYEGLQHGCRFKKTDSILSDQGAAVLPAGDEQTLKEIVAKYGPVAVAINTMTIQFAGYKRGVLIIDNCGNKSSDLDHAVLVVGYGKDPKFGDYWIVKNSWGDDWGDEGYIKMARNRNNMCGIATEPTIAIF